jgi:hypothetical protein
MTPGTLLVRFPAHSYDFSKSPYHPLVERKRYGCGMDPMLCTNSESSFQALQSELDETSDPWVTPHHHVVSLWNLDTSECTPETVLRTKKCILHGYCTVSRATRTLTCQGLWIPQSPRSESHQGRAAFQATARAKMVRKKAPRAGKRLQRKIVPHSA